MNHTFDWEEDPAPMVNDPQLHLSPPPRSFCFPLSSLKHQPPTPSRDDKDTEIEEAELVLREMESRERKEKEREDDMGIDVDVFALTARLFETQKRNEKKEKEKETDTRKSLVLFPSPPQVDIEVERKEKEEKKATRGFEDSQIFNEGKEMEEKEKGDDKKEKGMEPTVKFSTPFSASSDTYSTNGFFSASISTSASHSLVANSFSLPPSLVASTPMPFESDEPGSPDLFSPPSKM